MGIKCHLHRAYRRIAVGRSCGAGGLDDGTRFLVLPDYIRLVVAVGDDKSDVPISRHFVKGVEAQRSLLHPSVLVVRGYGFTGRHANKCYWGYGGEDGDRKTRKRLVHDFALQVLGWHIADEADSW